MRILPIWRNIKIIDVDDQQNAANGLGEKGDCSRDSRRQVDEHDLISGNDHLKIHAWAFLE